MNKGKKSYASSCLYKQVISDVYLILVSKRKTNKEIVGMKANRWTLTLNLTNLTPFKRQNPKSCFPYCVSFFFWIA